MTTQHARRRWWIVGPIASALALTVVIGASFHRSDEPPRPPSVGPTSATPSVTPTEPPPLKPQPPFEVVDSHPLTLPDGFRYAEGDFYLRKGGQYLVRFDLTVTKAKTEPGLGMYLGASFSCRAKDKSISSSIGGTENLLPGETTVYTNHLVLRPRENGVFGCSVLINAPYDDVAAKGATVDLDVTWRVTKVDGTAVEADSEESLPATVIPGSRVIALQHTFPIAGKATSTLRALASLHVTTCTGVNGSREHGKVWCGPSDIDAAGNAFRTELRADIVDDRGDVCGTINVHREPEYLDKYRHHQLIPVQMDIPVPVKPCGTRLRVAAVVENDGPASIVVHQANSSLITVG